MAILKLSFLILFATFLVAGASSQTHAEEYPPPTLSLPDTDTTPVEFSVGDIWYRVPRNYITTMDNWSGGAQNLVTLAVNIPDLKPYSQDTTTCFTEKDILRQPGCEPFTFEIKLSDSASSESRKIFHGRKSAQGPFGFEKINAGSGDEYYRKTEDGRTYRYSCQIFDNEGKRDGICEPIGNKDATGPVLHYFFALNHLEDIDQIDASLRNLVDSFMISSHDD